MYAPRDTMERRLRSSLQSSAEKFLSAALDSTINSSKSALKTVVHGVKPSSEFSSSIPRVLADNISLYVTTFQKLLQDPPSPSYSPPEKRLRRSQRKSRGAQESETRRNRHDADEEKQQVLEKLRILAYIASLCMSHPKDAFPPSELLLAITALHDNLILFDSDAGLSNDIAGLCERWWKEGLDGREELISQALPFLLSRSLTFKKKGDVHRVYSMRDAFALFDFEDDSIEDLKMLLMRCVIEPLYLKTEEGRKLVASVLGLSKQILKEGLAVIRAQIPFGRKSALEAYSEIVLRSWKAVDGELKVEIEDGFLQGLIEGATYARSSNLAASIRRILSEFINQRTVDGVEKLLFRLASPIIFRSLQVTNSNVRLNALHLMLNLFPLEDPDATKEAKDSLLDKQFFLLNRLLMDDCPDVRAVAVEGCCRILHLFWEVIPSSTIAKIISRNFDDMSRDSCCEVRLSTVNGILYLLGNPQSHEILKVLLPRLGHLIQDSVTSVRSSMVGLLIHLRDNRTLQFNKVVSLDVLLSTLASDQTQIAQQVTRLLMPSYFPSRIAIKEAFERFLALLERSPMGGARFCECLSTLGVPLDSLMQLVREIVSFIFTHGNLDTTHVEGLFLSVAHLCKDLASDSRFLEGLEEFFSGETFNHLLTAAQTAKARSAVFEIASVISTDNITALIEFCLNMVVNCVGLLEDPDRQSEVKSVHKFLLSCDAFDSMLEAFTGILQKTAYRCHIKYGCDIRRQKSVSRKRKKTLSSKGNMAKWKHVSGEKASSFVEDYTIAGVVAWQIKELLTSADARKAISHYRIMDLFYALEAVTEASIVHLFHYGCVDLHLVLAYAALALHMTLHAEKGNYSSTQSEAILVEALDHILCCTERMFHEVDCNSSNNLFTDHSETRTSGTQRRMRRHSSLNLQKGSRCAKQINATNKMKILTAVLKFIIDSAETGRVSHLAGRCLNFICAYFQHVISLLGCQSKNGVYFVEEDLHDAVLCLKSSVSYASKFLNLMLRDATEDSAPPAEILILANNLLELIASIELSLGSANASRLVAAASPWLSDLIIVLASGCIHGGNEGNLYFTILDNLKHRFPSWLIVLAKTELRELEEENLEENEDIAKGGTELPVFRSLIGSMTSLMKRNAMITDALGLVFLISASLCLERKEYEVVWGLLRFLCIRLIGQEDKTWAGLDRMLEALPAIYPNLEREIDEQEDEDNRRVLLAAKELVEPIWLYHIYETQRFTMTQGNEE